MSNNSPNGSGNHLRCPACRARQPLQSPCRRCGADLELLVDATRYCDRLVDRYAEASSRSDLESMRRLAKEIALFAPDRVPDVRS